MDTNTSEKTNNKKSFYLLVITAFMVVTYITSNVMAVKLVNVFGLFIIDGGTLVFPIAFMLGDVLTEIWGFKTAKKVIFITFVCNVFFVMFTYIGILIPTYEGMQVISMSYKNIFMVVPRILFASILAFLTGEIVNSWVLERVKNMTKRAKYQPLWVRTISSSAVGYVFDTVIFVLVAFFGTVPFNDLCIMAAVQYIIKLFTEIVLGTPFSYILVHYIRKGSA